MAERAPEPGPATGRLVPAGRDLGPSARRRRHAHDGHMPDLLTSTHVPRTARRVVGGFFLWTGGIHVGLLSADPTVYRHFADQALFDFVSRGWAEVFMAQPRAWAMALAMGETIAGALLLTRGRAVAIGWAATVVFHGLLLLFGLGFWLWAVPALAALSTIAWADRSEWLASTPGRARARLDHPSTPPRVRRGTPQAPGTG